MRIRRIDLYRNAQPFRFAFVSMHADRRQASGLLLRVATDGGVVGWGESTPRAYVSGETTDSVRRVIDTSFAPLLFTAELGSVTQVATLIERLEALNPGATSALGAVDLALWDAWGRTCGRSACSFFAAEPVPPPALSLSVPILPTAQIRALHPLTAELGVSQYKLVLSDSVEENRERLAVLRELVGAGAVFTADANGKLLPAQVAAMLPALTALGLSAIEQPAPKEDREGLRRLRLAIDLPVTVDESVCTLSDARRAVDQGLCDGFNLKLSKCGGLHATRKILSLARQNAIACQLGSHVGETPILAAAGQVAALSFPDLRFMEIGSAFLDPCPWVRPPALSAVRRLPGLGLEIDTQAVEAHLGPPILSLSCPLGR